jgi:hypothetical protein
MMIIQNNDYKKKKIHNNVNVIYQLDCDLMSVLEYTKSWVPLTLWHSKYFKYKA